MVGRAKVEEEENNGESVRELKERAMFLFLFLFFGERKLRELELGFKG